MGNSIETISVTNLLVAFIPVVVVIFILWKWQMEIKTSAWAFFRMLIQLILIGYVLTYIFEADQAWVVIGVLAVMLFSSSWIALRTLSEKRKELYLKAFVSIVIGGVSVLLLIAQGVLLLDPWYLPQYIIPLAGMIFANSMNSVSLAGERMVSELERNPDYVAA
ncbi:MAG: ABC transporter permease [Cyclobacteriaceae bacterium]